MDVNDFSALIGTLKNMVGIAKDVLGIMPGGAKRDELAHLVDEAEKKTSTLEADVALRLGYRICRGHWPPVVMLERGKPNVFKCPECEREVDTSPASVGRDPVARSRLMDRAKRY